MSLTPDSVTFFVLALVLVPFGWWARGHTDLLLPTNLDDEEFEYRTVQLQRGAIAMIVAGLAFVVAGAVFLFV